MSDLESSFARLGFAEPKIKEILRNKATAELLALIATEAAVAEPIGDKTTLLLLQLLALLSRGDAAPKRALVTAAVVDGRLRTNVQVEAAYKYVVAAGEAATNSAMEAESGVGVVVSREEVLAEVAKYIEANKEEITSKRYQIVPLLLGKVKALPELRWALPALFKPVIDEQILALLGPKDERDVVKKEKKKKETKKETASAAAAPARSMYSEGFLGDLHKPGENPQAYPELMKEHIKATGGKVVTRFPPEPNGYLHIGHAKAIAVNFGYARFHKGVCYLRFDDTNPEAEEEEFVTSIKELVKWLGFAPFKITYSSDYFDQLYDLAEALIKADGAYVCYCTAEEVKKQRGMKEDGTLGGERYACPHRSRPVEELLAEFRAMRDGKYKPGAATLRMKQDLTLDLPQMWDLVAYRVLDAPHHRTGTKWKIYPTYDFTHCLVDLMENILHLLCTTEFFLLRELYEWLCDAVHVFRPAQREYGRLNLTGTIMLKRKIAKMVSTGVVRGWDDPRLFTLEGLKRRGIPPGAILQFINTLGVTTSTTNIQELRLEALVRTYLDATTPRLMMVLDPVKVVIDNLPASHVENVVIPYKAGAPACGERTVPFTNTVYIDRSDYRDSASDEYYRLAPGQPVGLMKVPHAISVVLVEKDASGKVTLIHAHYDLELTAKPKTFIQWVPHLAVPIAETRITKRLFLLENPSANPDGFLADVNPDLEEVVTLALVEPAFQQLGELELHLLCGNPEFDIPEERTPALTRFQAMRVGYFCLDKDSTKDKYVLNRIVTLKEDSGKD